MNNILKAAVRSYTMKVLAMPMQQSFGVRSAGFARSLWHMSKTVDNTMVHKSSIGCSCGCGGARFAHTSGEQALIEFLEEEIEVEKQNTTGHLPSQLGEYQIKYDGAEVKLTKELGGEKVVISFNVNHSVDSDNHDDDVSLEREQHEESDTPSKIESKPDFEVDIVRGGTTLSMTCTYLSGKPVEGEYDDVFGIQELTIYKGEFSGDKVYACAGDMLDGYFYDLLLNMLLEKGIDNALIGRMSELSSQYEQSLFLKLLQDTKKFFEAK